MIDVHYANRVLDAQQAKALRGEDVPELAANMQAGIYCDAATSDPIAIYLPMPSGVPELREAVLGLKMGTTLRRETGMRNVSRTFGMVPRRWHMRREGCRVAGMGIEQPEQHAVLVALADVFSGMIRDLLPAVAAHDAQYVDQVLPEWRLTDGALWTSGVVNRSSTLPYHFDGSNFPTWSVMPVIRRHMRGGYLSIPEYDLVCPCRDGWALFFIGSQLVHGVTPMRPAQRDAYRYSIVYYALQGMKDCFTHAIEQRRANAARSERETRMARGEGLVAIDQADAE